MVIAEDWTKLFTFAGNIFKRILLDVNYFSFIQISPKDLTVVVQVMVLRLIGDKLWCNVDQDLWRHMLYLVRNALINTDTWFMNCTNGLLNKITENVKWIVII